MNFDWDEANTAHIARHGVKPVEAEEALNDRFGDLLDVSVYGGEERFRYIGATIGGRVLIVSSTMRGRLVRVVTAFNAGGRAARAYRQGEKR